MLPAGQVRIGRYLVGKRIALGGMGEVRLALQQALGEFERPVALKLLLPHLAADPTFVRMFLDEARLVSRMNHPNIVQIFDVGRDGETYFIAMELVEGVSLATLIRRLAEREQQLPPEALVYVGHALCDALAYAHEQKDPQGHSLGLVHRDVTPHNVLVSQTGVVKLTDFGIAKARESGTRTQTETGVVKGKLAFLAPEQIEGTDVDHRADVFGAAVTLFRSPPARARSCATPTLPP